MEGLMSFIDDVFPEFLNSEQLRAAALIVVQIAIILVVGRVALRLGRMFIDRVLRVKKDKKQVMEEAQIMTLNKLLKNVLRYVVYFFLATIVLSLLGIPIASLIAGAGVIGLAIGFGAQNLVRDIISGFFFLFEDQFTVGDYIKVGSAEGFVEELGLRITKIRGFAGEMYIIPNGHIGEVTNFARENMRVRLEIGVAYHENLDRVIEVMERVCQEVTDEHEGVAEAPKVLGVQRLGDSSIDILIIGRAKPLQNWSLERLLRLRIKQAFDREGIEIPFPQRVIHTPKPKEKKEVAGGKEENSG